MSTLNNIKKKMGRPPVDSEAITVRMQRPLLNQIDEFAGSYGTGRPEAVRSLVTMAFALTPIVQRLAAKLEVLGDEASLAEAQQIRDILAP